MKIIAVRKKMIASLVCFVVLVITWLLMSDWPVSLSLLRLYPKKLASVFAGRMASASLPEILQKPILRRFANHYDIDLSEAEKPLGEYRSLQELFTRRLKPGLRPQDEMSPGAINSPVDGRLIALGRIRSGGMIQAKGMPYRMEELLRHIPSPHRFEGGHYLTLYLSPKDYHRIHVPVEGSVTAVAKTEGELWPVNDASTAHIPRLYERNRRAVWLAEGSGQDEGLIVACVLVGATHVGSCVIDEHWLDGRKMPKNGGLEVSGLPCAPGDDLGMFQFGSTVVMLVGGSKADEWQTVVSEGPIKVGRRLGGYR